MENNTNNHKIKFGIKWDGDSLLGLLDGEYSVNVIVADNSAIQLDDGSTAVIKTGVSKVIYNSNDRLEYIFVKDIQIQEHESSKEISTTAVSIMNPNENDSETYRIEPPQNISSSRKTTESNQMGRCAECGKIVESEVLTQGVCRFCQMNEQI